MLTLLVNRSLTHPSRQAVMRVAKKAKKARKGKKAKKGKK
jgi:hypothetical protein